MTDYNIKLLIVELRNLLSIYNCYPAILTSISVETQIRELNAHRILQATYISFLYIYIHD